MFQGTELTMPLQTNTILESAMVKIARKIDLP
jgi:hypothetical protein